jgi:hypothetical protein
MAGHRAAPSRRRIGDVSNKLLNAAWPIALSPPEKAVLVALADCVSDTSGTTFIAVRSLTGKRDLIMMTCLGERTIQRALQSLKNAGHISWTERPGSSRIYAVHPVYPRQSDGAAERRPAAAAASPARADEDPVALAPEPILTLITPPSGRSAKRRVGLPEGWRPPVLAGEGGKVMASWSNERLGIEQEKFLAHHEAKGSVFVDWDAAWRTWVLNSSTWDRPERKGGASIGWSPVSGRRAAHA